MYQARRLAERTFVPIRGHRYHVRAWGEPASAAPPLVLLHGWMDVAASYQFVVDALPDAFVAGRRIVAPDWRGFGHTTGPAADHHAFVEYLGDLDALLEHVAGDAPVDLVGHSMGANVAMLYAGARPARVRRLVNLEGFGLPAAPPAEAPTRHARWLDDLRRLRRGELALRDYDDLADVAARLMKTNPRLPRDKADWLAREWSEERTMPEGRTRRVLLGDAAHRVASAAPSRVDEVLAAYARIAAPTLVLEAGGDSLAGWWQGRYTLDEFHQRLAAVRDVRVERLPGCGHMLHHDQPAAVAALIAGFTGAA